MYGHKLSTKGVPSILLLAVIIQLLVQNLTISICTTIFLLGLLRYYRLPKILSSQQTGPDENNAFRLGSGEHLIIGHRGGGLDAPENTLAAIRLAKECGAHGVEVDMEMTSDNIAVLMHDDTLDRTTDGKGCIREYSLADVRKLNAAHFFQGDKYTFEKIPTLEEAVQECLKLQMLLIIDVKSLSQEAIHVLTNLYQRNPQLYKYGVVSSFYPNVIYKMNRADHNIHTSLAYHSNLLVRRTDGSIRNKELWKQFLAPAADIVYEWAVHSFIWFFCGLSYVVVYKNLVSRDFVDYWKDRNVHVIAWGVNTQHEKRYFENNLGVSYMTDNVLENK